jgi:hypothetical protein
MHGITAGRMVPIIALRLLAIRCCDRIIKIEKGRIVAEGRYGDLIRGDGRWVVFIRPRRSHRRCPCPCRDLAPIGRVDIFATAPEQNPNWPRAPIHRQQFHHLKGKKNVAKSRLRFAVFVCHGLERFPIVVNRDGFPLG